jgi:NADH-quinone oxidoreductase subunit N
LNVESLFKKKSIFFLCDLYSLSTFSANNAKSFIVVVFSMIGIPPLGGFWGKLFLYFSALDASISFAVLYSLVVSLISSYYYLNLLRYIFFEKKLKIRYLFIRFVSFLTYSILILSNAFLIFFLFFLP